MQVQRARQEGHSSLISLTQYPFFAKYFRTAALHFCHKNLLIGRIMESKTKISVTIPDIWKSTTQYIPSLVLLGKLPSVPLGLCSTLFVFCPPSG